jgi:amino ABC transporter, permease protein, 3-TM region, his/glu/gln/arg/opine family
MTRPFDVAKIFTSLKSIFPYLGITFCVVLGTVIFGTLLSVLVVRQKFCSKKIWRRFADSYIHILRCTPSLILLFIVFYGIPKFVLVLFGININFFPRIIFVIIALSLLYSAQMAEIIRSALLAVGREQYEAGLCVGLSRWQSMFRIIVPQAFVIVIPNLGNSLIALLKEGSLAYTIGLIDVMGAGNLIISRNYGGYALETYIALAIIYWSLTLLIENLFKLLEKHYSKGHSHV